PCCRPGPGVGPRRSRLRCPPGCRRYPGPARRREAPGRLSEIIVNPSSILGSARGEPMRVGKRVVVTGYGAVTSLGENSTEVWEAILARRLGYRPTPIGEEKVQARFFGFLEQNPRRLKGLPKSLLKAMPEYARNALVAAREAVGMAFG